MMRSSGGDDQPVRLPSPTSKAAEAADAADACDGMRGAGPAAALGSSTATPSGAEARPALDHARDVDISLLSLSTADLFDLLNLILDDDQTA